MDTLKIDLPASWLNLSRKQLAFVYKTMVNVQAMVAGMKFRSEEEAADFTQGQINLYLLMKFAGFKQVRRDVDRPDSFIMKSGRRKVSVSVGALHAAAATFDFTRNIPLSPVRLEKIDGASAVAPDLQGLPFGSFLALDNYWQGYIYTHDDSLLRSMAEILYSKQNIYIRPFERLSIFFWFASVKQLFSSLFPHFFQASDATESGVPDYDTMRRSMNAQIRALTKGDITKEETVKSLDTWSALTELDALAREYEEMERKYGKK